MSLSVGKKSGATESGQALLALARNGVDPSGRIIGAIGPNPSLKSSAHTVDMFRRQVIILDMIGTVSIDKIARALIT